MDQYLVTGGAGFIGSNIALRLAKSGAKVRILDNFALGMPRETFDSIFKPFGDQVELIVGDTRDADACNRAMSGISHVLHHASISSALESIEDPVEILAVNVVGTANLLNAAKSAGTVQRFVNASTCAVYGDGSSSSKTESAILYPGTPFATSMHAAECLCTNFYRSHKLCAGSLRYFNVYGPSEVSTGCPRSAVAHFIDASLNREDIVIYGGGSQTRDFIHVDDAVTAALKACHSEPQVLGGQIFNVGTGQRTSIMNLLEMVAADCGCPIECISADARSHEMKHSKADTLKASYLLGFDSTITIDAGVCEILALSTEHRQAA